MNNENKPNSNNSDKMDQHNKEKKYAFYRKPSIKKKGPEVKHTKTSLKRMLQANPLMQFEMNGLEIPSKATIEQQLLVLSNKENKPKESLRPDTQRNNLRLISGNALGQPTKSKSYDKQLSKQSLGDFSASSSTIITSTMCEIRAKTKPNSFAVPSVTDYSKAKTKRPVATAINKGKVSKKEKTESHPVQKKTYGYPIRRSLSAQHFDRIKGLSRTDSEKRLSKSICTQSSNDLLTGPHHPEISPIIETSRENSLIFRTPSAYERRSNARFTPHSVDRNRSLYQPSSSLPSLEELQKRLNDWLIKRGKSLSLFHNLKCLEGHETIDEENKENIEVDEDLDKGSYEDLRIPVIDESQHLSDINMDSIAKAALVDLQNLIQEGYPHEQCEGWLQLIRDTYTKLEEDPEYWECRAAIEEARGNISRAVDCYKTAIVQGAKVEEVDKSLDVLLQKFSLLNISTEKVSKERARIVKDARNIFKSSIIKFAVQQKKFKNSREIKLVATPVRRSTRLSRSAYCSTPGVKICSSLKNLDDCDKAMLDFRQNKALM